MKIDDFVLPAIGLLVLAPIVATAILGMPQTAVNINDLAQSFFTNLYYHPEQHFVAIVAFSAVSVALIVGIAYIAINAYEACKRSSPGKASPE